MSLFENAFYKETKDRAKFFQNVHAWPLLEDLNYDGWLKNFDNPDDLKIACALLDFFTYYSHNALKEMFRAAVGSSGHYFKRHFEDWTHDDFKSRCIYSFIPGETLSPTDSGYLFTRLLRDSLGVPENRIVSYNELAKILDQIAQPTPVVLVDDFVGSGAQINSAWNKNIFDDNGQTLKEFALSNGHIFVYTPMIVNHVGFSVVQRYCPGLQLSPAHVLGKEYCLFEESCFCWRNNKDLFAAGVEMILRKSQELNIPSTSGKDVRDEKGFDKQGLCLAFHHGMPDAVPAIFYWNENWTPLIRKQYHRVL